MEFSAAERKKALLPFMTAWVALESIMLSETNQAVKDKYYRISPISGTQSTKQTSKQNRTRDMEINKEKTDSGQKSGEGNNGGKKEKGLAKQHV